MNPTLFFSICSLLYCALMIFTLFSKSEKKDAENKILKFLILINFGNLICESIGIFLGKNYQRFTFLNDVVLRLMLVFYIAWFSFFVVYILNVSRKADKFNFKDDLPLYVIMLIGIALVILMPMTYVTNDHNVIIYSTGPAVQVVYYYILASNIIGLFVMFRHIKTTKVINYASLFALIILSTLAAAIQSYYPSLLLTASAETFVLYVAYTNIKKREALETSIKEANNAAKRK